MAGGGGGIRTRARTNANRTGWSGGPRTGGEAGLYCRCWLARTFMLYLSFTAGEKHLLPLRDGTPESRGNTLSSRRGPARTSAHRAYPSSGIDASNPPWRTHPPGSQQHHQIPWKPVAIITIIHRNFSPLCCWPLCGLPVAGATEHSAGRARHRRTGQPLARPNETRSLMDLKESAEHHKARRGRRRRLCQRTGRSGSAASLPGPGLPCPPDPRSQARPGKAGRGPEPPDRPISHL